MDALEALSKLMCEESSDQLDDAIDEVDDPSDLDPEKFDQLSEHFSSESIGSVEIEHSNSFYQPKLIFEKYSSK